MIDYHADSIWLFMQAGISVHRSHRVDGGSHEINADFSTWMKHQDWVFLLLRTVNDFMLEPNTKQAHQTIKWNTASVSSTESLNAAEFKVELQDPVWRTLKTFLFLFLFLFFFFLVIIHSSSKRIYGFAEWDLIDLFVCSFVCVCVCVCLYLWR